MLTNENVVGVSVFVKCQLCWGRHLLGVGSEVPVYWCGKVLRKLRECDDVEMDIDKAKLKWIVCHHCGCEHIVGKDDTYFCRLKNHHVLYGDEVFEREE